MDKYVIGVSLSEPHTSMNSLCTYVCMLVCLDQPLIVNFKLVDSKLALYALEPLT